MRNLGKLFALIATIILLAGLTVCSFLLVTSRQPLELPAPRGPFAVGRTSFDWTDASREEQSAPKPGTRRELMVWVWYPAQTGGSPLAAYLPEPLLSADRKLFLRGPITRLLIRDPDLVHSHSLDGPPVAGAVRYPVILFRPGCGALALQYTTLAEDLASRGYVVVAVDAPYSAGVVAFADGRIITRSPKGSPPTSGPRSSFDALVGVWAADSSFALSKLDDLDHDASSPFHKRLDLGCVGAVGHSFGGAAAAEFCETDTRCKAAIDVDGLIFGRADREGVGKPFMLLLTDHTGDADEKEAFRDFRRVLKRHPAAGVVFEVRGTRHFNVSDMAFVRSPVFLSRAVGAIGHIDRRRGINIVSDYIAAFFDLNLKAKTQTVFDNGSALYPEVRQLRFSTESGWRRTVHLFRLLSSE